jgi:F0F1-type ATP synthase assembly protein I
MEQRSPERPLGDPWRAFGHVVSGVVVYGALGWLADRWLGTGYLVAVGIVLGAALGVYATHASLRSQLSAPDRHPPPQTAAQDPAQPDE